IAAKNLPPAAAAHLHSGAAGVAGPVVVPFATPNASGTSSGCAPANRALVEKILKTPASYYVNVHTAEFPGGAIRGQLTGTADSSFGWVAAINLVGSTEPNAKGTAVVRIRQAQNQVCYRLTAENITLPAVAAHIHRGGSTANGPVVVPFTAPGANGSSDGCATADAALISDIMANPAGYYVNVHTTQHPAGAMPQQLGWSVHRQGQCGAPRQPLPRVQAQRPRLDRVDREVRAAPRILREPRAHDVLRLRLDDVHVAHLVGERATEHDEAV